MKVNKVVDKSSKYTHSVYNNNRMSSRLIDITGKRFGRLTVLSRNGTKNFKSCQKVIWKCVCDCGTVLNRYSDALRNGRIVSCGCFQGGPGVARTHGLALGKKLTPELKLFYTAKKRAKSLGLEFKLEVSDVIIPEICPLLGLRIRPNKAKLCDTSPTLDRITNTSGYVKGNIWVVSYKANRSKNNLSISEMRTLLKNLEAKHINK